MKTIQLTIIVSLAVILIGTASCQTTSKRTNIPEGSSASFTGTKLVYPADSTNIPSQDRYLNDLGDLPDDGAHDLNPVNDTPKKQWKKGVKGVPVPEFELSGRGVRIYPESKTNCTKPSGTFDMDEGGTTNSGLDLDLLIQNQKAVKVTSKTDIPDGNSENLDEYSLKERKFNSGNEAYPDDNEEMDPTFNFKNSTVIINVYPKGMNNLPDDGMRNKTDNLPSGGARDLRPLKDGYIDDADVIEDAYSDDNEEMDTTSIRYKRKNVSPPKDGTRDFRPPKK